MQSSTRKISSLWTRPITDKPFRLDGKLELDVSFNDHTMMTDVYFKMDASDQLLLSEGVYQQLGIVTYHPEVDASLPQAREVGVTVNVPAVKVEHQGQIRALLLM